MSQGEESVRQALASELHCSWDDIDDLDGWKHIIEVLDEPLLLAEVVRSEAGVRYRVTLDNNEVWGWDFQVNGPMSAEAEALFRILGPTETNE
jgi:hypothetical protein